MSRQDFIPQVPYGTKDILPVDAARKRGMENELVKLFLNWGYQEVITPTFEYHETLKAGSPETADDSSFRFFDRNGRMLALRPDMTTPIARVAVMRMKERPLPLRLFYLANVFRQEETQAGRQCEFYQAGVELLGTGSVAADAEVVALAVESLLAAGLIDFQVCLGQVDFISGIMSEAGLDATTAHKVKQALIERNMVGLSELLEECRMEPGIKKLLQELPMLHGKMEMLQEVHGRVKNKISQSALDNLAAIYRLLENYGIDRYVMFDLGIIRDLDYYTGMVFEAYTTGLGYPICGGGRYDRMAGAFGREQPATGFAMGIERVLMAVERQGLDVDEVPRSVYVGWAEEKLAQAIAEVRRLRAAGEIAEMGLQAQTRAEAEADSKLRDCIRCSYFD
ncbi:MAG TPA: ATP phosphoribosyltransferase regulatory subunit [Negativicutes bacterium]|nr:ATP phosphoribosyltransferase regulatory subunit [Negativicutes bacterium]